MQTVNKSAEEINISDIKIGTDVAPILLAKKYIDLICNKFSFIDESDIVAINKELSKLNTINEQQTNIVNEMQKNAIS